ncbi:hypothetical protein N325_03884, partial [Colius striatus]
PGQDTGDKEQNVPLTVQKEMISGLLLHIDVHKSMGLDGVHPRVPRELAGMLAKPLCIIYQQSWLAGEVPSNWKSDSVKPVYKKGQKDDPGNYKPVSLTSVPGKLMEQIILSSSIQHMQDNQVI